MSQPTAYTAHATVLRKLWGISYDTPLNLLHFKRERYMGEVVYFVIYCIAENPRKNKS